MNNPIPIDHTKQSEEAKAEFNAMLEAVKRTTPEEMQKHLARHRKMPYEKFLQSIYWKIVRQFVMADRNYLCQSCKLYEGDEVHHLSYKFPRGMEHANLDKLVLLCDECHEGQHADRSFKQIVKDFADLELWTPKDEHGRELQRVALDIGRRKCAEAERNRAYLKSQLNADRPKDGVA